MLRWSWLAVIVGCLGLAMPGAMRAQEPQTRTAANPNAPNPNAGSTSSASKSGPGNPGASSNASSVQALMAMLNGIDPYRPFVQARGKVQVFGSTAMDNMAHAWTDGFKKFHPEVTVEVSAAGSGDAFEQLKQNPQALVMLSRPVTKDELEKIKSATITQPVAFVVAREALGVFVHASNPVKSISGEQMRAVFTKQLPDSELKWKLLGATGDLAEQPIRIVSRAENSGTQAFLREFVFGGLEMRTSPKAHGSNGDVLGALSDDPLGITICGLRANGHGVRALPLVSRGAAVPSDDAAVLSAQYPLTRDLTLVVDMGQKAPEALAAQELVHFALCRHGQLSAIQAGFFPAELPNLRAGLSMLERDKVR